MSASGVIVPFFPPIAQIMPFQSFDAALAAYGVNLTWQKSHLCPCGFNGPVGGTPDPQCVTCSGRGWYWDAPSNPFKGLITFVHMSPSPDEPGAIMSEKFGPIQHAEPTLTLPFATGDVWKSASLNDIFTQLDAIDRFNATLEVGGIQTVPYQQGLTIAPTGAVSIYDTVNHVVSGVSGYVVSGALVTLPSGFVSGTSYIVEFSAAKSFIAWRSAGSIGHDRPFGAQTLPKRFRLQALDLWLRNSGKI